ncbi:RNA-binding protein 34 [Paragonimus heterotremus]|uniref:RNA-binding protein 34 n=1 Tax=Paragonimus heterotremus TaxID=100268 RepID=A0A8J4T167_9TREM|nr:RNA-binding protein 34 [Paragonimus heterotremus]
MRRPDEKTIQRDMNTERMNRTERPKVKGTTAFESIGDIDPPSSESSEDVTGNEVPGRSEQRAHRIIQRERLRRTLFVGNLPLGVKRRDLEKLFTRVLKCDNKAVESDCRVESVRLRGVVPVTGGTGKMARKRAVIQGEFSGM